MRMSPFFWSTCRPSWDGTIRSCVLINIILVNWASTTLFNTLIVHIGLAGFRGGLVSKNAYNASTSEDPLKQAPFSLRLEHLLHFALWSILWKGSNWRRVKCLTSSMCPSRIDDFISALCSCVLWFLKTFNIRLVCCEFSGAIFFFYEGFVSSSLQCLQESRGWIKNLLMNLNPTLQGNFFSFFFSFSKIHVCNM